MDNETHESPSPQDHESLHSGVAVPARNRMPSNENDEGHMAPSTPIMPSADAQVSDSSSSSLKPPTDTTSTADRWREVKDAANAKVELWREARRKQDPSARTYVYQEADLRHLLEEVEAAERGLSQDQPAAQSQPMVDFFQSNMEARPEIIEGIIREGQFGVLGGTYGVGKSPVLSHIAICTLNGIPWCGRRVSKRPVIAFDFESSGPTFKRNYSNAARRFEVNPPRVPDEFEAYVEHDSADAPGTAQLLEIVKQKDQGKAVDFLELALERKPNALVLIDPLELLFRIDTRDKKHILWLYARLRHLLARFPQAAILFTVNLRKKDRQAPTAPDLFNDPRGWLEDVSGSLDILNRCDVRLGLDFYGEDKRVINGVRRGEDMQPILIRPFGELPDGLAGFEVCAGDPKFALTGGQLAYWNKLPAHFRFEDVADTLVPRATLYRLIKKAQSLVLIEQRDGVWFKTDTAISETSLAGLHIS